MARGDKWSIELDWTTGKDPKPFLRLRSGGNHEIILSGESRSRASGARETAKAIVAAGLRGFKFVEKAKPRKRARRKG